MAIDLFRDPRWERQFEIVEQRLRLWSESPSLLVPIARAGLDFMCAKDAEAKANVLNSGHISLELLQAVICGGEEFSTGPIVYIWERLIGSQILIPSLGHIPGAFASHSISKESLRLFLNSGTFLNIFITPAAIVERYAGAVAAIDIKTECGDQGRGSGFLACDLELGKVGLITCAHNVVEGNEVQRILLGSGHVLDGTQIVTDTKRDLACIGLSGEAIPGPFFRFGNKPQLFDEVFTLGHPHIPLAEADIVGHRGEVNGFAVDPKTQNNMLLISNYISPGSSGGPVIDRAGFCVGMASQWREAKYGEQSVRFSLALPSTEIAQFLKVSLAVLEGAS